MNVAATAAVNDDMSYYKPQERRSHQLNVRVTQGLQENLDDLAKLWTHFERVRTKDPKIEVTVSDVVIRLLEIGLDGAWNEVGGRPKTETEWEQLFKRSEKLLHEAGHYTKTK